jgi:hypothetical protein
VLGEEALMLVLVAVRAQEFPVAPIGRIVVVVVIAMVDFQKLQIRVGELAGATTADPGIDLERSLAIARGALFTGAPRFGDDAVEASIIWRGLAFGHGGSTQVRIAASLPAKVTPWIGRASAIPNTALDAHYSHGSK